MLLLLMVHKSMAGYGSGSGGVGDPCEFIPLHGVNFFFFFEL